MHSIFVVRGFIRQLDSLSYKIDVCTDIERCREFVRKLIIL